MTSPTSPVRRHYRTAWEGYWTATRADGQAALWDGDPAHGCASDIAYLRRYLDPTLPLIDVGCGNGTQTRYLARAFPNVIGVDVAPTAIALARAADPEHRADYRPLDMFDAAAVAGLHDRLGDANVYLRGVLHQILPADRPRFARSLAVLPGKLGGCLLVELAPDAGPCLADLARQKGSASALAKVLDHGIVPGTITREEVRALLGPHGFVALAEDRGAIHTAPVLPGGRPTAIPAYRLALRRRPAG